MLSIGLIDSEYVDILIRFLLAGYFIHQPPKHSNKYYILRNESIQLFEIHNVTNKLIFGNYKILENYGVSLPLDEDYDDTMNCWVHFDFTVYEKEDQLWMRLSNQNVGFQRNLSEIERQNYLKI